ncbi:MAG: AAA family ATPase [Rhodospirillaceae bacterium]|nr:AAA family ATPase [Rhodospirillaceae bacterium]
MDLLPCPRELEAVKAGLRRAPVSVLFGPRQCGKTTLAGRLRAEHVFNLENPRSLARLAEPQTALEDLRGTVVIDEVQRMPSLFALLRVLADRSGAAKFLLLGSASPELVDAIRPMQQLISPPAGTHNAHPGAGLDLAFPIRLSG